MVKWQIFRNFIVANQLVMNKIKPLDQLSPTGAFAPSHIAKLQNKSETRCNILDRLMDFAVSVPDFRRTDKGNTQEVWFYDLRTNMPSFGKTNPLKLEHFADFEAAFEAADRRAVKDERWSVFTREQIAQKGNSLDLGLIRDDSVVDYADLPDPVESGEEAIAQLEEAVDLLQSVVNELKALSEVD